MARSESWKIESNYQVEIESPTGENFWAYIDRLVGSSTVVIDRPKGSHHPRYPDFIYPIDYGYLQDTSSADGDGIDVWMGSLETRDPQGVILTIDLGKRDLEAKILIGCTETEIETILEVMNTATMRAILIDRHRAGPELLWQRQSVRRFLPDPVPQRMIDRVLAAAMQAPSAHNRQPWRFVVLGSVDARTRLADDMGADFRRDLYADGLPAEEVEAQVGRSRRRILDAPVAIVLCCDTAELDDYPDKARQQAEHLMGVQSVAMAGENLLLAAQAAGLGGVWMCAPLFTPETVRRALDLPAAWEPQGMILLGFPRKIPERYPRRRLEEVVVYR